MSLLGAYDGSVTTETSRTGENMVPEAGEELNVRYEELLSLMEASKFRS